MPGSCRRTLTFYPRRIMRIRYNVWHYSPVAQSVERLAVNQLVAGSSPARGAILDRSRFPQGKRLLFLYTPYFDFGDQHTSAVSVCAQPLKPPSVLLLLCVMLPFFSEYRLC